MNKKTNLLELELITHLEDVLPECMLDCVLDYNFNVLEKPIINMLTAIIKEDTKDKYDDYNIKSYAKACLEEYNESLQGN